MIPQALSLYQIQKIVALIQDDFNETYETIVTKNNFKDKEICVEKNLIILSRHDLSLTFPNSFKAYTLVSHFTLDTIISVSFASAERNFSKVNTFLFNISQLNLEKLNNF